MSIAVGTIAFCLTVPLVLVVGGVVFGSLGLLDGEGLLPTGFAVLFLVGILGGLTAGTFAGIKYYRHMEKPR
jgi:hypothetical protein